MMNVKAIESRVVKLHAVAANKSGNNFKCNGHTFSYRFHQGVFEFTDNATGEVHRFNTRQISVAKRWMKNYLEN